MTDELDPAERRIARALTDFAETPFPSRGSIDLVISRAVSEGSARTMRTRAGALLAAAVVFAVGLGALSQLGFLVPAATPSSAVTPAATTSGVGTLHLTTDAGYDHHDPLDLRYVLSDGSLATESDSFPAETTVFLDTPLPAGQIRVLANDRECRGTALIEPNVETDVVLSVVSDVCTIETTTAHPIGLIEHPEPRTALGVFVVIDSVLVVRPLDPENQSGPIRKSADERAEVVDFDIRPGRYELALEVDGEILATMQIELVRGQEFYYFLRALHPDIPRDCGEFQVDECEAAIAEAYETPQGAGSPAASRVTSVRVRPSPYVGGCQPNDPPVYLVTFEVRDEPKRDVTLGRTPEGRLYYCTY